MTALLVGARVCLVGFVVVESAMFERPPFRIRAFTFGRLSGRGLPAAADARELSAVAEGAVASAAP